MEQHGKHMPLGTDVLIPLGIAQEVAGRTLAVIAPSFPYGLCSGNMSGGGRAFRGTISTSGSALDLQMKDVLSEFLAEGICRVLVLNGHSENESSIFSVLNQVVPAFPGAKALLIDWWNVLPTSFVSKHIPEEIQPFLAGHASYLETLMLMAVRPDLVNLGELGISKAERDLRYEVLPMDRRALPRDGVYWAWDKRLKSTITPELARIAMRSVVDAVMVAVSEELE